MMGALKIARLIVTCMVFICFMFCLLKFLVDPDIGEIGGK